MSDVCVDTVKEHLSAKKVKSKADMVTALQKARGRMRQAGGAQEGEACHELAPEEPLSVCGSDGTPPKKRALDREDLYCEMMTWQWEELGDGNPAEFDENGCPFDDHGKAQGDY